MMSRKFEVTTCSVCDVHHFLPCPPSPASVSLVLCPPLTLTLVLGALPIPSTRAQVLTRTPVLGASSRAAAKKSTVTVMAAPSAPPAAAPSAAGDGGHEGGGSAAGVPAWGKVRGKG